MKRKLKVSLSLGAVGLSASGLVVALMVGSTGTASGESTPPTTSFVASAAGVAPLPASAVSISAIISAMPGFTVATSRSVATGKSNYDEITGTASDGSGYTIDVYHNFSRTELINAGLPSMGVAGGTLWVGSDGPDQRSVYFFSSKGSGVWISSSSTTGNADSLATIQDVASGVSALVPKAMAE